MNLFVEDMANTPEGAEAVYQQAIEELEEKYASASTVYNRIYGELTHLQNDIASLNEDKKKAEKKCEALVKAGDMENAKIMSERRGEIVYEIESKTRLMNELTPKVEEAKNIHTMCQKRLEELKREKSRRINELVLHGTMRDLYNDLDTLKRTSDTDKLLGSIRDYSEDLHKEVTGAAAVHNNKTSTKIDRAESSARAVATDDYLESLKSKYSK